MHIFHQHLLRENHFMILSNSLKPGSKDNIVKFSILHSVRKESLWICMEYRKKR